MERFLVEAKPDRQPRRSGVGLSDAWRRRSRRTLPLSVDRCRACAPRRLARSARPRRARASTAARACCSYVPSTTRRRDAPRRLPTGWCAWPRRWRPGHHQRPRRHRALAGAAGVHVGQDDLAGRRRTARCSAQTRLSAFDARRRRRSTTALRRAERPTSPSGRSSAPRPRTPATTRVGLDLVAICGSRRRGNAGRRHRRHHPRPCGTRRRRRRDRASR